MDLDEQMQQLENRLNEKFNKRLESEISELNRKLDQVITRLNSPSGGASVTSSPHSTAPSAKSEAVASRSVKSTVSHFESTEDLSQLLKPRAIPSVTSNGSESVMTSNLLPIAAVICFVLAAIFIVKLR